ncbi:hypothetical protein T265_01155 [Opisthorchis viverrini]|uniref:Uncharacterized protein n=1 Tax=Opisthorchis viverrini TaxID=6198 RepID=A0A075AJ70_OPIVI|nr:hypothetical protein T265_01155 [Opisthorchis viverrini]KER32869.1 hypothetical protein T265_01155 [Opisthorchis viverrini]
MHVLDSWTEKERQPPVNLAVCEELLGRTSNPTSASRLPPSRLGQPGSIAALVLPSGSMAARHRKIPHISPPLVQQPPELLQPMGDLDGVLLVQLDRLPSFHQGEIRRQRRANKSKLQIDETIRMTTAELRWNMDHGEDTMIPVASRLAEPASRTKTQYLLSRCVPRLFARPARPRLVNDMGFAVRLYTYVGARWLEREFTDRRVRCSNPTSASRLFLSRLEQPDSITALVPPSGGMAARHRKGAKAGRFFYEDGGARLLKWLVREFTARKIRGSSPTSASRLFLSRLGQPGSISALVFPLDEELGTLWCRHRRWAEDQLKLGCDLLEPMVSLEPLDPAPGRLTDMAEASIEQPRAAQANSSLGPSSLSLLGTSNLLNMTVIQLWCRHRRWAEDQLKLGCDLLEPMVSLEPLDPAPGRLTDMAEASIEQPRAAQANSSLGPSSLSLLGTSNLLNMTVIQVRGSNPNSTSRLSLSRLGQPDSILAFVLPSGGMAGRHRKGVTAERFFPVIHDGFSHPFLS